MKSSISKHNYARDSKLCLKDKSAPKFQSLPVLCAFRNNFTSKQISLFMMSESEGSGICSVESCTAFSLEKQGPAWLASIGYQESCLDQESLRSEISHPEEPDCVKNYQEAVAEQWAKIPVTPYSFHRATAGSSHLDRAKLKGMFQPSGQ